MFDRINWPFKDLKVGESCNIKPEFAMRARAYVHVYAGQARKRLSWKSNADGSITVTRLPDERADAYEFTEAQIVALKGLFPSKEELRRFGRIVAEKYAVSRTPEGNYRFASGTDKGSL